MAWNTRPGPRRFWPKRKPWPRAPRRLLAGTRTLSYSTSQWSPSSSPNTGTARTMLYPGVSVGTMMAENARCGRGASSSVRAMTVVYFA